MVMRPDISTSNLNAVMARPHSKHKVKRNRWTRIETLNKRKEKSVDSVRSGINSKHELPVVCQVVTKLQELCKAVLVNAVVSEGDGLKVKQDLEECSRPSVGKGDAEISHSEVPDILSQRQLSDDTHSSRIYGTSLASSEVLLSNDTEKVGGLIKVEICEPECLRQEDNNLRDINRCKDIDLDRIIKRECGLDVAGANTCIHIAVKGAVSCKAEPVDQVTDICPLVEHTAASEANICFVENNDGPVPCATTGDLTVSEKGEALCNEMCGNEALPYSSDDIALDNLSRSDCQCYKAHDSTYLGPIKPENYVIPAANESFIDRIPFNGVGYSTDEDGGNCPVEIQKLSGPHFWMGKRKRASGSLMSLSAEESLDSLVSSGASTGESLPGLKNYSFKDEIPYSGRNYQVVLPGDTDKLYYQEVYDSGSTSSSPDSRYATSLVLDPNTYGCINRAQSWSPTLLSVSKSAAVHSYMKPDAPIPFHSGTRASDALSRPLCEDVRVVPTSYTAVTVGPAPTVSQEGTENLNSDELFRSIEESLAERETFKYQEEEIFKRIERSLTETESLKCCGEQLLNKIGRSLTEAKSLKSQEEELLRRIEVSLGQRKMAMSQGEGLLIGMETSLQNTQYDMLHADSVNSMEFGAESKPDLDKSLPLKKRKKWLKAAASDGNRRVIPLESFPSFPLWPMISIAELEAFGKLQHRVSFPSFPSQPMISIAELETRTAFGKLRQREFESSAVPPCISGYPHYCKENDFCDESFFSRDIGIGRTCDDFLEQNATAFPLHKVEGSSKGLGHSEMSNNFASSQPRDSDMSCDKVFGKGEPSSAETSSMCRDAAEDSKADIKLFFGPATNYLSNVAKDSKGIVQSCERAPTDLYKVDAARKDNKGHEVTVTGSECRRNNIGVLSGPKSSTELVEEFETRLESKYIKVEKSCEGRIEDCALNYPSLTDMNSEASSVVSGCREVDVTCHGSIEMLSNTVNAVDDSGQDFERNTELQGNDEGNVTFTAIKVETEDNVEWCKTIDVPLAGSECAVNVDSRDKDCL